MYMFSNVRGLASLLCKMKMVKPNKSYKEYYKLNNTQSDVIKSLVVLKNKKDNN